MRPYEVTQDAMDDFLASATEVPLSGDASPEARCALLCLTRRRSAQDYSACNGFAYQGGSCRLGYKEPDWVVEQGQLGAEDEGGAESIYFDVMLPRK